MAGKDKRITIWFDELEGEDFQLVGEKNAKWGEMLRADIPASPGFALTVHANDIFITETGIKTELKKFIKALGRVSYEKSLKFSKFAIHLIENTVIPAVIIDDVFNNYRKLCDISNKENVPLAIGSSGALPMSRAMSGQLNTYLNVRGEEDLENTIKKIWASVFLIEAITDRINQGMGYLYNIGIGIAKMVNPRISGVICTLNPLNGDESKISLDVSYGLSQAVTGGLVTPDTYLVDKATMEVISYHTGSKERMCAYEDDGPRIKTIKVPKRLRDQACITNDELMAVGRIAKSIDNYYGRPNDIEFAIDADFAFPKNVVILRIRPESVWSKDKAGHTKEVMDRMMATSTNVRVE